MLNSLTIVFALILPFPAALSAKESPKLSVDQNSLLEDTRAYALQYVKQLPNFVCTQITHRDVLSHMPDGAYTLDESSDTIEEQLTYVDGKEGYTVLTLNGKKAPGAVHSKLDGAISWGEFGSLLSQVFDPASHTVFSWDREEHLNGRGGWAFKYRVPKESGTTVVDQASNRAVIVAYSGRIVIDPDTKDVLEISSVLDIPATFRIKNVTRKVLYSDQEIGGKKFCLPSHSELHMEEGTKTHENQIDFKDYHRFSSDSTIHFDSPAQ